MKALIKRIVLKEKFNPKFIGIFINPYYFNRRGLYKGVKENAHFLSGRLLDFGCGNKPYKELFNVNEYVGLDIEESGHGSSYDDTDVYYDGKTIPFSNENFDCVLSSEVFEHVFELDSILKEINRVCKIDGHLLITVPFVWNEHEVPYDFGRYTSFGIKYILEKHGFEIVKYSKTSNYVETLFQMWNTYIFQYILRMKWAQSLLTPFLISPITIVGILASKILPKSDSFFLNNVVVAKKIKATA